MEDQPIGENGVVKTLKTFDESRFQRNAPSRAGAIATAASCPPTLPSRFQPEPSVRASDKRCTRRAARLARVAKGFRRLKAHKQLPALHAALEAHQNKNSHDEFPLMAYPTPQGIVRTATHSSWSCRGVCVSTVSIVRRGDRRGLRRMRNSQFDASPVADIRSRRRMAC